MRRPIAAFNLFASLLPSLVVCPVFAGPVEDATIAYRRGDYETAYQLIKPQAEKGDAVARPDIGLAGDQGQGVRKDHAETAKWYRRAAE